MAFDPATSFQRALAANSTQTGSYAAFAPTATEPLTTVAIPTTDGLGNARRNLLLMPFGIGADASTFKLLMVGWRLAQSSVAATIGSLWIPAPLAQFLCTLDTGAACTGVAVSALLATEFLCDAISLTGGNSNVDVTVTSPAGFTTAAASIPGSILMDVKGCLYVQPFFDRAGSATSANVLFAFV